jgi:hypothetical protein
MAKNEKLKKLPEGYDPLDLDLKKQVHEQADQKNRLVLRSGRPALTCGAKKPEKKGGGFCRSYAGMGTDHPGYGRCKFCGGSNTGPSSPEAKKKVSQNARKHGFYSKVLTAAERDTYEELLEGKRVSLEDEIFMLKAKILSYLKEKALFYQGAGRPETVFYKDGEEKAHYKAGTIEDKPLTRALETLRRLVDSHAKLTQDDSNSLLEQVNAELRAASQGNVSLSWSTGPQRREEKES